MRIKPPPRRKQPLLFDVTPDKPLLREGEKRARFGRLAEKLIYCSTGTIEIGSSGLYDAVYDGFWDDSYVEIKNVKKGSQIPLYLSRIEKDRAVVNSGKKLTYLIVIHSCFGVDSLSGAISSMASTVKQVIAAPFEVIESLLKGKSVKKVVKEVKGSRVGYQRKGYCRGYRLLSVSEILKQPMLATSHKHYGRMHDCPVEYKLLRHSSLSRKFLP